MEGIEHFQPYIEWLAAISILSFLISIICIPWYIRSLPVDYFHGLINTYRSGKITSCSLPKFIVRNLVGSILLLAGIAMLFIPGQGILTMLFGMLLMQFPGKNRLSLFLLTRPSIQRSLNWSRQKLSRPSFLWK